MNGNCNICGSEFSIGAITDTGNAWKCPNTVWVVLMGKVIETHKLKEYPGDRLTDKKFDTTAGMFYANQCFDHKPVKTTESDDFGDYTVWK